MGSLTRQSYICKLISLTLTNYYISIYQPVHIKIYNILYYKILSLYKQIKIKFKSDEVRVVKSWLFWRKGYLGLDSIVRHPAAGTVICGEIRNKNEAKIKIKLGQFNLCTEFVVVSFGGRNDTNLCIHLVAKLLEPFISITWDNYGINNENAKKNVTRSEKTTINNEI